MKIGILTLFHNNYNWGGVLQGYALKTYLESNFENVTVDILQYHSSRNVVYTSKFQQALQYSPSEILGKIASKLKKRNRGARIDLKERKFLFDEFMNSYKSNPKIYNDGNLISAAVEYDCLICGSDQIWNPNVARPGYFLQMVNDECRKISYAASIARDDLSKHEREIMLPLIEKFDYVSVREKTAKDFLNYYMGSETIKEVLDPALMLSHNEWEQLCDGVDNTEKRYALAFFFSESLEYREDIYTYCQQKGLQFKFIPFAKGEFIESDLMGPGEPMVNVGPKEFVQLFKNAEVVFTDSFHGSVFSIIFSKNFCVFERDKNNKVSKNSRLYDLLAKFELSDYLIKQNIGITKVLDKPIDYKRVNELLNKYRQESHMFLTEALLNVKVKERYYSQKKLFIKEKIDVKSNLYESYLGYSQKEEIRRTSSSGGLFFELASVVLQKNGTVYGAAYKEDHTVEHIGVSAIEELKKLQCSKYVQSKLEKVYTKVEEELTKGKIVLFSGTPCQIAAVKNFVLNKTLPIENLYLIDFICHGVPSPALWKSYIEYEKKDGEIAKVNFRDKSHGWHDYYFHILYKNNKQKGKSHELNAYMRTFLSDKNLRPSCYECIYKDEFYSSDITLGDAWKVEKDKPEWADDKGTSLFVVRSPKGKRLLQLISKEFVFTSVNYSKWSQFNPSLIRPTERPNERDEFFSDYKTLSNTKFWRKYSTVPMKKKIRYGLKVILKKTGLEKTVRKFI